MGAMASQITSLIIVYSTVYSGAYQRKHQSSASLAFVRGIHRGPVNSPHKWPVTRKMFPFDDVMDWENRRQSNKIRAYTSRGHSGYAQTVRGDVTLWRRLSMAEPINIMIPECDYLKYTKKICNIFIHLYFSHWNNSAEHMWQRNILCSYAENCLFNFILFHLFYQPTDANSCNIHISFT